MANSTNLLVSSLQASDLRNLEKHLRPERISAGQVLFAEGQFVDSVYFPINAVISLTVALKSGRQVSSALIGRDGVLAASAALDGKISLSRAIVRLPGETLVCEANKFKKVVLGSPSLLSTIIRHEQTLYAQSQQHTACLTAHDISSQLTRLLLRMRDLYGQDEFLFTQEGAAEILGARRTSVTEAAVHLRKEGTISYRRGRLQIKNVSKLQEIACECYSTVRSLYADLAKVSYKSN